MFQAHVWGLINILKEFILYCKIDGSVSIETGLKNFLGFRDDQKFLEVFKQED